MRIFGTPDERMFRSMNFYSDQSGILRRYNREKTNWETHLQNTRNFAVKAIQNKKCKSAAVLGSGWLLDVPVKEFTECFDKVILFDIRHPKSIKKRFQKQPNVVLFECDISEFANNTYHFVKQFKNKKKRPQIDTITAQPELILSTFDFVFSCNILNQLDILLIDYLSDNMKLNENEILSFRKKIQQHHIDLLPRKKTCLVSDYEEILHNEHDEEISRTKTIHCPVVFQKNEKWTWDFDTCMTYHNGKKTFFEVFATEM